MTVNDAEVVADGRFLALVKRGTWEYVTRINASGVVIVVPQTDDGKLIFGRTVSPAGG